MTGHLVSICIPTYNRSGFLRESLRSIRAQSYQPIEILISDNHSTDDTEQVCRAAALEDSRIRYVRQPRNLGMHANHNFCIDETHGEFLCFFHDDDVYTPRIVERYVEFMLAAPSAGLVCSNWGLIDQSGQRIGERRHRVAPLTPGYEYIDHTIRTGQSWIGCPGTLIRRAALGTSRFDESGPIGFSDFALWFQVAERSDVGQIDETLWDYRLHTASFSRRTIASISRDFVQAIDGYCAGHLRRYPGDAERVERWRWNTRRFLFWALAYEIGLTFRDPDPSEADSLRYRTVFELADYRLSSVDLAETIRQLDTYRTGALQAVTARIISALVTMRCTRPLAWVTRYPILVRRILGLG